MTTLEPPTLPQKNAEYETNDLNWKPQVGNRFETRVGKQVLSNPKPLQTSRKPAPYSNRKPDLLECGTVGKESETKVKLGLGNLEVMGGGTAAYQASV